MTTDPKPRLDAGTILTLIVEVGLPLASDLIDLFYRAGSVSADDWTALRAKTRTPFDDLVPARPGGES